MTKAQPTKATTNPTAAAEQASNKAWKISLIVIGAVMVLALGGTIFYGTVIQPQIKAQGEKTACTIFMKSYIKGQVDFMKEFSAKDHKPDMTKAINNFMNPMATAANKAGNYVDLDSPIGKALTNMAFARLNYEYSKDKNNPQFPNAIDQAAGQVQSLCEPIIGKGKASATPTPTN